MIDKMFKAIGKIMRNIFDAMQKSPNAVMDSLDSAMGTGLRVNLLSAIESGDLKRVKSLIRRGADVKCITGLPLDRASESGNLDIAQAIIDAGADVSNICSFALQRATENNDIDMVELLLENGADPNNHIGSPLKIAVEKEYFDMIRCLSKYGMNFDSLGNRHHLKNAAKEGNLPLVKCLVECGAGIKAFPYDSIEEASDNGHKDVVKYLKHMYALQHEGERKVDRLVFIMRKKYLIEELV